MNIKINYVLIFALLLLCGNTVLGQTIQGKIMLDDHWKNKLYLVELSHYEKIFSGSTANIVDSIPIRSDGSFTYSKLKKNTLYGLNAVNKDNPGAVFIQDGEHDNYTYFVTNESKAVIQFKGNIDHLYASYSISSKDKPLNDLLTQIMHIRSIKFMHYNFMHQFDIDKQAIDPTDTFKIAELERNAMMQLQHNDDSLNVILSKYSSTLKNPEVLSYAMTWYGFWLHLSDKAVQEARLRLVRATHSPLAKSVVEAIVIAPSLNTEAGFMRKDYPLISGGTIRLSNISSDFILLDFWASWCTPCRKGIKTALKYLKEKYSENRLTIIGIALDAEKEKAVKAMQKDNNNFVQIYDGPQPELKKIFNVEEIPHYELINTRTGTIERIWIAESIDDIISEGK